MKPKESVIATVVYLIKGDTLCLAQKKQHIHIGKEKLKKSKQVWNGYGGKREPEDVSVRDTAIRELEQESGVKASPHNLIPAGKFRFFWHGNESKIPNMDVYFFFLGRWVGAPQETGEMGKPTFFSIDKLPYRQMMPNDAHFLPRMLANEKPVADVHFGDNHEGGMKIIEKKEELLV